MNALKGLTASIIGFGLLVSGCIIGPLPYESDMIYIESQMISNDGFNGVNNVRIDSYDVDLYFYDGTIITERFTGAESRFENGVDGSITGFAQELGFYGVDGGWSCDWVCLYTDEYGYCTDWYEECYSDNYSYDLDEDDISSTDATITYRFGSSWITTLGSPGSDYGFSEVVVGEQGDWAWAQRDTFYTPLEPTPGAVATDAMEARFSLPEALTVGASLNVKPVNEGSAKLAQTVRRAAAPSNHTIEDVLTSENAVAWIEKIQKARDVRQGMRPEGMVIEYKNSLSSAAE